MLGIRKGVITIRYAHNHVYFAILMCLIVLLTGCGSATKTENPPTVPQSVPTVATQHAVQSAQSQPASVTKSTESRIEKERREIEARKVLTEADNHVAGVKFGATVDEVIKKFGKPESREDGERSKHEMGDYKTYTILRYPKAKFAFGDGKFDFAWIQDPNISVGRGIKVGEPASKVVELYGPVPRSDSSSNFYVLYPAVPHVIGMGIEMKNDVIVEIRIGYRS